MSKIVAHLSNDGILLYFGLEWEEGTEKLSTSELIDFVDSDIPLHYKDEIMTVNDYLGESRCFTARVTSHEYNPF